MVVPSCKDRDRLVWVSFSDRGVRGGPGKWVEFWIRVLVTSFVTSELGNRAYGAVPGQALRAVSPCGVVANGSAIGNSGR